MDLFKQICANIAYAEDSASVDIITPFGLKRMPQSATIVCNSLAPGTEHLYCGGKCILLALERPFNDTPLTSCFAFRDWNMIEPR